MNPQLWDNLNRVGSSPLCPPTMYSGAMTVTDTTTYRVRLDGKRRPTLPAALLDDAGINPAHELVAHTDGHGRVILEDPLVMLATFQHAVAEGKREHGITGSLVDDLIADRAADPGARG